MFKIVKTLLLLAFVFSIESTGFARTRPMTLVHCTSPEELGTSLEIYLAPPQEEGLSWITHLEVVKGDESVAADESNLKTQHDGKGDLYTGIRFQFRLSTLENGHLRGILEDQKNEFPKIFLCLKFR